jgi:hypothetical protein
MSGTGSLRTGALVALALALLAAAGCREPDRVDPVTELHIYSVDSTHIDVGFPESLDPVRMTDPANYFAWLDGGAGAAISIHAVSMADSVRGRAVRLETDPVPDATSVLIQVRSIRLLTGVSDGRDPVHVGLVTGLSYYKDVAPLLAAHCNSCHSGATPAASYATDAYFSLFGPGTTPTPGHYNLVPGDPRCRLVWKTAPTGAHFWTGGLATIESQVIRDWVVNYLARQ